MGFQGGGRTISLSEGEQASFSGQAAQAEGEARIGRFKIGALLHFGPTGGDPSLRFCLCPEIRNVRNHRAWAANDHLIVAVLLHYYFVSYLLVLFHFLDNLDSIGIVSKDL